MFIDRIDIILHLPLRFSGVISRGEVSRLVICFIQRWADFLLIRQLSRTQVIYLVTGNMTTRLFRKVLPLVIFIIIIIIFIIGS